MQISSKLREMVTMKLDTETGLPDAESAIRFMIRNMVPPFWAFPDDEWRFQRCSVLIKTIEPLRPTDDSHLLPVLLCQHLNRCRLLRLAAMQRADRLCESWVDAVVVVEGRTEDLYQLSPSSFLLDGRVARPDDGRHTVT